MVLSVATLKQELLDRVVGGTDPVAARSSFAEAYTRYVAGSTLAGTSAVLAVLQGAPKAAFVAALATWETPGTAPVAIQAGVVAFWAAALGAALTVWAPPVAPAIYGPPFVPPPGSAGVAAAISGLAAGSDRDVAMGALAAVLHAGSTGATVTVTPQPAPPGVPAPVPVL